MEMSNDATLARYTVAPVAAAVARVGVWHNITESVILNALHVDLTGCHEIHATIRASNSSNKKSLSWQN